MFVRPSHCGRSLSRLGRIAVLFVLLALWPEIPQVFAAVETYQDIPVTVRLGYTTFERGEQALENDPTLLAITRYLELLGERSRMHPYFLRRLDFEVAPGNDYQIHQWLSTGQLDAAIVSPFTAWLLEDAGIARPVLELAGKESCCLDSKSWDRQGHRPMVRATWDGEPREEPETVYSSKLRQLENRIRTAAEGDEEELDFALHMRSHLSTAGFVVPLLYAADFLDRSSRHEEALSPAEEVRFWRTLLDRVVFDLHPGVSRGPAEGIALYFSHTGIPAVTHRPDDRECYGIRSMDADREWLDSPWVPNDVVVVRHDWDNRLFYGGSERGETVEALLPEPDWIREHFDLGGAYTDILDYDPARHRPFREAVAKLLTRPHLAVKGRAWYGHGDFDFTLPDTLEFLDPGRTFGLVLPGGGVKSAYQAVLLDHLYGKPLLFNARARRPPSTASGLPLRVDRIVGTSGGAMMGFFAAQVDGPSCLSRLWLHPEDSRAASGDFELAADDSCASDSLAGLETVSSTDLFDLLDFPRWLSLLLLLSILQVMPFLVGGASSLLRRSFSSLGDRLERVEGKRLRWRWLREGTRKLQRSFGWVAQRMARSSTDSSTERAQETSEPPQGDSAGLHPEAALLAVVIAVAVPLIAPFLLAWLRGPRVEHIPQVEGLFYATLVVLGHMILVCAKAGRMHRERLKAVRIVPLAITLTAALGLIVAPFWIVGAGHESAACWSFADDTLHACSLAVLAGLVIVLVVILLAPRSGVPFRFEKLRPYWIGIGLVVVYFLTVYAVLGTLAFFGWTTALELTLIFWERLALTGVVVAFLVVVLLLGAVRRGEPRWLVDAMSFSVTRQRIAGIPTTPRRTFYYAFVGGLLLWNALNAPALYGNETMRGFFHQRIEAFRAHLASVREQEARTKYRPARPKASDRSKTDEAPDLKTPLVVTGVLLEQTESGAASCSDLEPGEIFFCFDATGDCPEERGSRWMRFAEFTRDEVADAVLASGSPFPIFAAHPVRLPNECTVALVDGGYTNNVPLEAADLAGVEQALIVYSQPVVDAGVPARTASTATPAINPDAQESKPEKAVQAASLGLQTPADPSGERSLAGSLVRYSGRLFPFLFERAQEVDRRVAQEMVVVSLAPLPESQDGQAREFPLLSDFRKATIRDLDRWAFEDLGGNRRIGRVESWGKPIVERIVRDGRWLRESTQRIPLPARSWDDRVRRALLKSVTDQAEHKVAVLDLDGTCLDGDLGTWLFAEMVVARALAGDDPALWQDLALLVDEDGKGLLDEARRLWDDNREIWRDSTFALERPDEWNPELQKFVRHFRQLQDQSLEAGLAELFYARLWNGFEEPEIESFTGRLFETLPAKPVRTASWEGESPPWQPWIREVSTIRELISGLRDLDWEVWLVGDAVEPAVKAAARMLGLPEDRVVGFSRDAGRFGPEPPWPLAKRRRLLELGVEPWLVVADGRNDLDLLNAAKGLAIVIDREEIAREAIDGPVVFFQPPFPADAALRDGLKTAALGGEDTVRGTN